MTNDIIIPVEIGGVKFKNPFYVASGPTTKTIKQLLRIEQTGWAAASIKLTIDPAPYINRVPRYALFNDRNSLAFTAEKRLKFEQGLKLVENSKKQLKELILFANITYAGDKGVEGWVNMAKKFEEAGADIIELNMCCPNMSYNMELTKGDSHASNVRTGASLGQQEDAVAEIVREIKKVIKIPLFVKLTPEGGRIAQVARKLYEAGADAVGGTANRLGIPPIDLENPSRAAYHLQDEISMSCHSGAWLKPLALRDTYEIRKVNGPKPRIMATGGVKNYRDAIEMFMCGADLIGICAETLISGYDFISDEISNLKSWMDGHGYKDIMEFRDKVVPEVKTAPELTLYKGYARIKEPNLAAPCKDACPMHVPVQGYVRKVAKKAYREAFDLITGSAPLQSICGFVCGHPCEESCTRSDVGRPVKIKDIKRFVLEYGKSQGWKAEIKAGQKNGRKAAVIGSGPAGISNAYYLAKAGYDVTIFEREQEAGGVLRYGIPSFRLPRNVLEDEIGVLRDMGIAIKTCCELGKDITIESLKKEGFDVIFLGLGTGKDKALNILGEALKGVLDASELLFKVSNGGKVDAGKNAVVLGDGYGAVDAARASVRLGASRVYVLSGCSRDEMTAGEDELKQAEVEGIRFIFNTECKSIESEDGHVSSIKVCNQMFEGLGEVSYINIPCDMVINATGSDARNISGINIKGANISIDPATLSTNVPGVYAGGSLSGALSIIESAASGYSAAVSMDKHVMGENAALEPLKKAPVSDKEAVLKRIGYLKGSEGANLETSDGETRIRNFGNFIRVMTEDEAVSEASRCLSCGCGEGCGLCMSICSDFAISVDKPDTLKINNFTCLACGMCYNRCPNRNIEMVNTGEKI